MTERRRSRDRGTVLPLVLVVVVVMALVIVALADYASTTLRYGQTVERSGDRLAAVNGAIDNTLEAIERRSSMCVLTPLVNESEGGYTFDLGDQINGLAPTVTCVAPNDDVTGIEEFAMILTSPGDLNPPGRIRDALLDFVDGGFGTQRKVIDGPVYFARPPNDAPSVDTINVPRPLTIRNGDVWYTADTACPDPSEDLPTDVLITPMGYDVRCLDTGWAALFEAAQPPEPSIGSFPTAPPADKTGLCHVWEPGEYASPPNLTGPYNYFKSGDYYFSFTPSNDDWSIADAWVLFGAPGPGGPAIGSHLNAPPPDPHPCAWAWQADTAAPAGASIYLGGPSHIEVLDRGALEITGRDRLGDGRRVAIQALETQNATTLLADTPRLVKVTATTSSPRRFTTDGLIWAPANSVELGRVSNAGVAPLRGGAVVGELHIGARPPDTNFLARAPGTAALRRIVITATAISPEGGSTTVEAVIDYRDGDYALISRRVLCVTPDDPSPTC